MVGNKINSNIIIKIITILFSTLSFFFIICLVVHMGISGFSQHDASSRYTRPTHFLKFLKLLNYNIKNRLTPASTHASSEILLQKDQTKNTGCV